MNCHRNGQDGMGIRYKRNSLEDGHRFESDHARFMANSVISDRQHSIGGIKTNGRGATLNPGGRHERTSYDVFHDGWETLDELAPFNTQVLIERPRKAITTNQSPDIPFDRSLNPYRGCEHGCIYCFARPSHAYMGHSPGLDFESILYAKTNIAQLLEKEISRPHYQVKPLAIGSNTDPYQPVEKKWRIMREVLELLERTNHPVSIVTKSALILRDIDILSRMAGKNLVRVAISVTSLDRKVTRGMEPRASSPGLRLKTIHDLAQANIPVSVMVAPVIPALNDHELEHILDAAAAAGARGAGFVVLRLPREVSPLFRDWLLKHHPDRYRHVMNLVRSMRGGKDYDAEWNKRLKGTGPYAWQIKRRFDIACKRFDLNRQHQPMDPDLFRPARQENEQLQLFEFKP